jgi:outer membrane protein TolC
MGRVIAAMLLVAGLAGAGWAPAARAEATAEAEGQASAVESLSLQRALDLALAASREVRQAERELEQARMKREETWDYYTEALLTAYDPATGSYVSGAPDVTAAMYQADYAWRRAGKQLEAQRDTVVRQVYEKYYAVLEAASALELAKLELENAGLSLKVAEARRAVGMETELSVASVRSQKAQAEAAVQQAGAKLEQAWQDLALLLGKPVSWRAELTDRPAFSPLEVADPEAEIARIVEASPSIWQAAQAVELARKTVGMSNSRDYDRLSLDNARDTLAAAREEVTQGLRNAYRAIRELEASYATAQAAADNAREALRVREVMYRVGMATRAEVAAARASLAKAEDTLLNLAVQHVLAKMAFFAPWAAGGTSGA